jgi:hypothetical protein
MSTQFSWETFYELLKSDPERAWYYECEHSSPGWLTRPAYEQGKADGEAEARLKGEAKVLARLLEKRFGALPESVRQRIFDVDVKTIDVWVERAFDAPTLQAVFEAT